MPLSLDGLLRHKEEEEKEGISDVLLAKVVAMVLLFAAKLFLGLLPMLLAKKTKWFEDHQTGADITSTNKIVLILLSFGGGVLLSTIFMHLLPEISENVQSLQEEKIIKELPFNLTSLLTCIGFFAIYFVEEVVHFYLHWRANRNSLKPPHDSVLVRTLSIRRSTHNNNCHSEYHTEDTEKQIQEIVTIEQKPRAHIHQQHSHMPVSDLDEDPVTSSLRGLLIVLALSIHEIFEGLTIGLESSAAKVWYMFGAVSAHDLVIAFCIGVELLTAKIKPALSFAYVMTFAIVSPVGIGIGIALSGGAGAAASGLPSVILQGIASGTLLYVVFFEILQKDRSGFVQLLSSIVGFLVMFGLQLLSE